MSRLVIDMPHPPRELSPNAKAPLSARGALVAGVKKTVAKKRCRDMAWLRTVQKTEFGVVRVRPTHYMIVWYYKGVKPDADNCLARCKAYLDGACKAMIVDDRDLECAGIRRIHDLDKGGTVEIVFEERRGEDA